MEDDDFWEPDTVGLEGLLKSEFIEYKTMIFRKHVFRAQYIDEQLRKKTPAFLIQHHLNHESMITYGGDIETQRSHGQALQKEWLSSLTEQFPHLYIWVRLDDSEAEVIVSVMADHRR